MLEFVLVLVAACLGWLGVVALSAYRPQSFAWVEHLRWSENRREFVRHLRSLSRGLAAIGLIVIGVTGLALHASAGPFDSFQAFFDLGWYLLLGGALTLFISYILREYGKAPGEAIGGPLFLIGVIALALGLTGVGVGFLNGALGGGAKTCSGGQILDPATNQCTSPTEYIADWDCNFNTLASGGPGGAHDASTEFPDSPFIASDGGTPDYDATIATPVYTGGKLSRIDITVDDELNAVAGTGSNNNGWLNEDTYAFDVNCKLDNAPQAVGGGLATQPLWGQISVPYTTGQAGNMTDDGVYVCDSSNGGVYLGFGSIADSGQAPAGHDADHTYVSYIDSTSCSTPPSTGDWQELSFTSTTTPDVGQWVAVWFNLNVGILSYEDTTVTYSMQVRLGTEPGNPDYRGNIETLRIDIIATDD